MNTPTRHLSAVLAAALLSAPLAPASAAAEAQKPAASPLPTPVRAALAPSSSPKLGGTKWEWTKFYADDDSVLTVKEPTRYVVEFLDGGKLSIQADCNKGTGKWGGVAPSLRVEAAVVTRSACPEGSLGERFVKLLSLARSFEGDGRRFSISLKAGEGTMRFRRAGTGSGTKTKKKPKTT